MGYRPLGFTGTRKGMTPKQMDSFASEVRQTDPDEFHHGCCIGADEDAVQIVAKLLPECRIIGHPPEDGRLISRRACDLSDELREPFPYLARNRHIVKETDSVIGCPDGDADTVAVAKRGGTVYTLRYARKCDKHVTVICPGGWVESDSSEGEGLVDVGA